jgi:hypothetical protein
MAAATPDPAGKNAVAGIVDYGRGDRRICGFADQSHLTRIFTRLVGTPPSGWRREHKGRRTPGRVIPNGKQGWLDETQ